MEKNGKLAQAPTKFGPGSPGMDPQGISRTNIAVDDDLHVQNDFCTCL